MLELLTGNLWPLYPDAIQDGLQLRHVTLIRSGYDERQRYAPSVRQDVTFGAVAPLGQIPRIAFRDGPKAPAVDNPNTILPFRLLEKTEVRLHPGRSSPLFERFNRDVEKLTRAVVVNVSAHR